jgi:hypothetical protein
VRIPRSLISTWLAIGLTGCAGRAPQPVAAVQPQDRLLDCVAITAEVRANNEKIQQLSTEKSQKVAQNVAAGLAGLFIWPLWFGMDFQGAATTETAALQSRQEYLGTLAEQKRCGTAQANLAADAEPRIRRTAPPVAPAAAEATQTPIANASGPGQVVLFPVTIYNPYYPSAFVNVQ